jgi:biotin operon repressor
VPLRRADRLFDIIRILRAASQPVTAAAIADELEVTVRTVYRDVATLQARRIPIEGAAGVGYVLRRGYELPPLMFTEDEAEAIAVGVRLLARTGDPGLQKAAKSVLSKVTLVVPDPLRDYLTTAPSLCVEERRAGSCSARPAVDDPPRDPRYAQDADRLSGRRRAQHKAGNPALCRRLLHGSDADLRLVRAAQRCPPFPDRPGGQRRCARGVILNP